MNEELIDLDDELFSPLSNEEKAVITGAGTMSSCSSVKRTSECSGCGPDTDVQRDADMDYEEN